MRQFSDFEDHGTRLFAHHSRIGHEQLPQQLVPCIRQDFQLGLPCIISQNKSLLYETQNFEQRLGFILHIPDFSYKPFQYFHRPGPIYSRRALKNENVIMPYFCFMYEINRWAEMKVPLLPYFAHFQT